MKPPAARSAARDRKPLDGADAQALEGALSQAERELADLRELLSTIVYWHDQPDGHVDESWWEAARETLRKVR